MREARQLPDLTTTLDDRRARLVLEGAYQTAGVIEVLLASSVIDCAGRGPMLRAMLLRLQETNNVTMRVFDGMDDDVNEMECIVFGKVQVRDTEAEEVEA